MSARYGTGGNNIPLVTQTDAPITDHHAVFSRQRVDVFKDDEVVSTQSARQHKDATDLVCQPVSEEETVNILLIRRLTPLECERLQGFPDGWTDIPGASDSARYKALGNSVAIPCVEYVMRGIVMATK
jgi:DNA (cytosine-5)-methyltransferase 1